MAAFANTPYSRRHYHTYHLSCRRYTHHHTTACRHTHRAPQLRTHSYTLQLPQGTIPWTPGTQCCIHLHCLYYVKVFYPSFLILMSMSLPLWANWVLSTFTPSRLGDSWALLGEQTGHMVTTHSLSPGLPSPIFCNVDIILGVAQGAWPR